MSICISTAPTEVLKWFEDETFYSLCSRQHCWLGHIDTPATLEWLYGPNYRSVTHDFPGNLDALSSRLTDCWGDVESIIYGHTIFPLFRPFQCQTQIQSVETLMRGPSVGSLKYRLGLLTGRFGAEHPLKACSICMGRDLSLHGVAYWHRSHQYPGVLLCPIHHSPLLVSALNRPWSGRFRWVLPEEQYLEPYTSVLQTNSAARSIGGAVLDLASLPLSRRFEPSIVCTVYRDFIDRPTHNLSTFLEHTNLLQPYSPFTSLPTTNKQAKMFISQMLRAPRGHHHPLKHLTLITFLFDRFAEFVSAYDRMVISHDEQPHFRVSANKRLKTTRVLTSPNRQTMARKPKKLKPPIRASIVRLLLTGLPKQDICDKFDITICTLNRIIREEEGLKYKRKEIELELNLQAYRSTWTNAVSLNKDASAKKIRYVIPETYAWLYRNDREWLNTQIRKLPSGRCGNNSRLNWDERDVSLVSLVETALKEIAQKPDGAHIKMNDIYRLVPILYRSLEIKDRYPKTRALIREIIWSRY
ncbi:TnsD family Tn7-like transposition protein [Pseudomonas sivasensis]